MDEEQWFTKDQGGDLVPLADQEALDAAVSAGRPVFVVPDATPAISTMPLAAWPDGWVEIGSTTDPDGVQGTLYARPAE